MHHGIRGTVSLVSGLVSLFLTRVEEVRLVPESRVVMDRPHVDQNTCPAADVVTSDTEERGGEEGHMQP